MFDAEAFQNLIINDANSTRSMPWPPGEYPVTIASVQVKSDTIKRGARAGQPWVGLSLLLEADPSVLPDGCSNVTSTLVMLDITESGSLDMRPGKNIRLGRLREAAGLNVPGQPFSFPMLEGRTIVISTDVRVDDTNPDVQYTEVKGFKAA